MVARQKRYGNWSQPFYNEMNLGSLRSVLFFSKQTPTKFPHSLNISLLEAIESSGGKGKYFYCGF